MRIESSEPGPGVRVVTVVGEITPATRRLLTDCLEWHLAGGAAVLVLDLSRVSAFDWGSAKALAAARSRARRGRVALELVVASYGVAKPLQISDPDALRCAWPSLDQALTTVCGPALR